MPYGEDINISVGDVVQIHPAYISRKFNKLLFGESYTVQGVSETNITSLRTVVSGRVIPLSMNKKYFTKPYTTTIPEAVECVDETNQPPVEEYTGSSSNYYKVYVKNPTTLSAPYEAECNDIIEALKMTFAEGNAFKAIWRKAKARQGVKKKGYDNGVYDSEKVVFFGERMLVEARDSD